MRKRNGQFLLVAEILGVLACFLIVSILVYRAWSMSVHQGGHVPADVSLHGYPIFPADDPWNTDISKEPVDENSNALIANIGAGETLHPDFGTSYRGAPNGIPFALVPPDQAKISVTFQYSKESDPGPYPIPPNVPVEANNDRHVLLLDQANHLLYELYAAVPLDGGKQWRAGSGAIFDLTRLSIQRPMGWTSADAAGLPIFPGLVRYEEAVEKGKIPHALRFTVRRTRRAFVSPATRFASRNESKELPPMGMRVRLKQDYDISQFPPTARTILQCLKTYGMILADHGGEWFVSGAPDPRWNDAELRSLKQVKGSAFEVVRMRDIRTTVKTGELPADPASRPTE